MRASEDTARTAEIVRLREAGLSLDAIGDKYMLTGCRVAQILLREACREKIPGASMGQARAWRRWRRELGLTRRFITDVTVTDIDFNEDGSFTIDVEKGATE